MRWLKISGIALLGLIIVTAAALWLAGGPVLAWVIEHPGSAYVGRQIHIRGPLVLHWGSPLQIIAEDVQVANAPGGSAPDMFTAKRLEIEVFASTLLSGRRHLPLIKLEGAKLLLEKEEAGGENWKFGLTAPTPKKRHEFPDLRHFTVHDSELVWLNRTTGARTDLGIGVLEYNADGPERQIQVMMAGTYAGSFQKVPYRFAGIFGSLADLRNPSRPYPVKLTGKFDEIDLIADGTIDAPLDVAGVELRLSMSGKRLDVLASALGVPMPELPDFKGTGVLAGGAGKWVMKALTIGLGRSDLEGGLDIDTTGKVPTVEANLTSSQIDLADFTGLGGAAPATSSAPSLEAAKEHQDQDHLFPDLSIEVHKLPGVNVDLSFYGTRILSKSGLPFERLALRLLLKDGAITVKPLRFHAAQGDLDINLHFTPFTAVGGPHLRADIDIRHVDLHQLLRTNSSATIRATGGIVGGFMKVDTNGTSMRQFLSRMDGDVGFFMQNGQISALLQSLAPIDIVGALGVYAKGDTPQPINCLVSRFAVKKGIATASTFLLDTEEVAVEGGGDINFADETLDLTLAPHNKRFTLFSLRTPVDIGGTMAHPAYHLHTGPLVARVGAAAGLGILFPPAALLPLIETGLGEHNSCSKAYAAQQPPRNPTPKSGSSTRP